MNKIYLVCKKAKFVCSDDPEFELELDGKVPLETLKATIDAVEKTLDKTGDRHRKTKTLFMSDNLCLSKKG